MTVVLPDPDGPTNAVNDFRGTSKEMFRRTCPPSAYPKSTASNCTAVSPVAVPLVSGSTIGSTSRISDIRRISLRAILIAPPNSPISPSGWMNRAVSPSSAINVTGSMSPPSARNAPKMITAENTNCRAIPLTTDPITTNHSCERPAVCCASIASSSGSYTPVGASESTQDRLATRVFEHSIVRFDGCGMCPIVGLGSHRRGKIVLPRTESER